MNKRRVVVTGIGALTPLYCNAEKTWQKIISGESGLSRITAFDVENTGISCKIAGQIKNGTNEGEFNIDQYIDQKEQKKMDRFIHLALAASEQAIEDSGWKPTDEEDKFRTGVMIGSGIGGLSSIEKTSILSKEKGVKKISPFFIPSALANLASGQISIKYGFMGPNHCVVTACASSSHAIGDSARMIQYGNVDVMVCGGSEAAICEVGVGGFSALRALSTSFNDNPTVASRPWDKDRDGFVMSEGSAMLVLEEYEHAKKRGAKIYGELIGYGASGDAYHITSPEPTGRGATYAMKLALGDAQINPEEVGYVNAHGTSTLMGDEIEVASIKKIFGDHAYKISVSSTKSSTGHLLGAAGAIEAIFSLFSIRDKIIPPTLNLDNPSESCNIDLTPKIAKSKKYEIAISNSFGFGGTNSCLVFKKI